MSRKVSPLLVIILLLVGTGLASQMIATPIQLIIPVVIFGAILLLYKFPPGGARARTKPRKNQINRKDSAHTSKTRPRKDIPFRVIEGGKDDDNLPKYH